MSMICSSGHKLAIIRALYEHLYPPCVLLMLQVCLPLDIIRSPQNPLFFFTILSWCPHTALISEASQGIICASFNHFHTVTAPFMNCCCSDGALMAALHNFSFFLVNIWSYWTIKLPCFAICFPCVSCNLKCKQNPHITCNPDYPYQNASPFRHDFNILSQSKKHSIFLLMYQRSAMTA